MARIQPWWKLCTLACANTSRGSILSKTNALQGWKTGPAMLLLPYPYSHARSLCQKVPIHRRGPVSYLSLALTLATGAALLYYHNIQKQKKVDEILESKDVSYGKASMGGPFSLVDHNGKRFSDKNLLGEFAVLYFGFTHCPDICPDELEKLAEAIDKIEKSCGARVQPVFISIDPERDTVKQVKSYVSEFHPRMIGLTGTTEEVKEAAKAYRVYYVKAEEYQGDYLVDHSIIMYLINPLGDFVTFYGKNNEADTIADSIVGHIREWARGNEQYSKEHPNYRTSNKT